MNTLRRAVALKERLSGSPSRRAAYYTLAQASWTCLAGSFEMPMVCRLVGRIDLVAFVYAFLYGFLFLGFAFGMVLLRKGNASRLYRMAIALWVALSLSIVIFFPHIRGLGVLVVYFIVRGLADGFYWSARHRSYVWCVSDSRRDGFALKLQALVVSLSVVLPVVGGFAITYLGKGFAAPAGGEASAVAAVGSAAVLTALPSGYRPVFLVAALAMIIALAFSPKLRIGESPISFRSSARLLRIREARQWCAYICVGGVIGAFLAVAAGIQTFGLLRTEFKVGALTASVALVSSGTFFLIGKLAAGKPNARVRGVFSGSVADLASRLIFALSPTAAGLVVKSLLDSLFVPLKNTFGENAILSLVERLNRTGGVSMGEIYVFREFALEFSRIVGCFAAAAAYFAIASSGAPDAPALTARVLIGVAAPFAIVDFVFVRYILK
jgi:hypothetical protein